MRKIKIIEQISLDGVIQAPGGPDEDRDGDYAHGGWAMRYCDTDSRQHEGGVLGRAHEHLSTRWIAANRIFRRRERLSGRSKPAFFSGRSSGRNRRRVCTLFNREAPGNNNPRSVESRAARAAVE